MKSIGVLDGSPVSFSEITLIFANSDLTKASSLFRMILSPSFIAKKIENFFLVI